MTLLSRVRYSLDTMSLWNRKLFKCGETNV